MTLCVYMTLCGGGCDRGHTLGRHLPGAVSIYTRRAEHARCRTCVYRTVHAVPCRGVQQCNSIAHAAPQFLAGRPKRTTIPRAGTGPGRRRPACRPGESIPCEGANHCFGLHVPSGSAIRVAGRRRPRAGSQARGGRRSVPRRETEWPSIRYSHCINKCATYRDVGLAAAQRGRGLPAQDRIRHKTRRSASGRQGRGAGGPAALTWNRATSGARAGPSEARRVISF